MKAWLNRNTILSYVFLVVVGILGAWLVGLFEGESSAKEITRLDLVLCFFGLMIFCAAIVGVVVLIARNRKPMTSNQGIAWEGVRSKGKWGYVRNQTIRASTMIVVAMAIVASIDYSQGRLLANLRIYLVITGGIIACATYAAIRFWHYYESEYQLLQSKPQHNKALQRTRYARR